MHFVDGSAQPPPKEILTETNPFIYISNPTYVNVLAFFFFFFLSLSKEMFSYVVGLTSLAQVWDALWNAFGSIYRNRRLQLRIDLQDFKRNDLFVSPYLQKAKALADGLGAIRRSLSTASSMQSYTEILEYNNLKH